MKKTQVKDPDWYYRNRKELGQQAAEAIRAGKTVAVPDAVVALREAARKTAAKSVTIRLAVSDIELAKAQAEQRGLPYQTYLKSVLHQALSSAR